MRCRNWRLRGRALFQDPAFLEEADAVRHVARSPCPDDRLRALRSEKRLLEVKRTEKPFRDEPAARRQHDGRGDEGEEQDHARAGDEDRAVAEGAWAGSRASAGPVHLVVVLFPDGWDGR